MRKKKKLIKERFYRGVQKQREKREGREIDRERYLLVIEDEPEQTFWRWTRDYGLEDAKSTTKTRQTSTTILLSKPKHKHKLNPSFSCKERKETQTQKL